MVDIYNEQAVWPSWLEYGLDYYAHVKHNLTPKIPTTFQRSWVRVPPPPFILDQ